MNYKANWKGIIKAESPLIQTSQVVALNFAFLFT